MRIIGIDPGSVRTGYAVVDFDGQRFRRVTSGHIALPGPDMAARLARIYRELSALIAEHAPQEAAVESVFMQKNVASAIKLGQARGAAICALACAELPVAEYPPATVKQMVCGGGRADKNQVNFMVRRLVGLAGEPQEDEADALAVAVCHGFRDQTQRRRQVPA